MSNCAWNLIPHLLFCSLWKSYEFLWQLFAKAVITVICNWISSYRAKHHIIPRGFWPNHIWFLVSLAFIKTALSLQLADSLISIGRRRPRSSVSPSPHRPRQILTISLPIVAGGDLGCNSKWEALCQWCSFLLASISQEAAWGGTLAPRGPEDGGTGTSPPLSLELLRSRVALGLICPF